MPEGCAAVRASKATRSRSASCGNDCMIGRAQQSNRRPRSPPWRSRGCTVRTTGGQARAFTVRLQSDEVRCGGFRVLFGEGEPRVRLLPGERLLDPGMTAAVL